MTTDPRITVAQNLTADCGLPYAHDPHLYRTTKRGVVKACDGDVTKRAKGNR